MEDLLKPIDTAELLDFNEEKEKVHAKAKGLLLAPRDPDDPCWLNGIGNGAIFLVSTKNAPLEFVLGEFLVSGRTEKCVYLLARGQQEPFPVDPNRFCRKFSLYEVLRSAEDYEFEQAMIKAQMAEHSLDKDKENNPGNE